MSILLCAPVSLAQQLLGNISGMVADATGAAVPGAKVTTHNLATNLEQSARTQDSGIYELRDLPIGTYKVKIVKDGFETEEHTEILVQGNRTTTVNGNMKVGSLSSTVEVTATPLMNEVATTNGYILDELTIQETPLGTGSFTQLAILSPGVNADFLNGSGASRQRMWELRFRPDARFPRQLSLSASQAGPQRPELPGVRRQWLGHQRHNDYTLHCRRQRGRRLPRGTSDL